MRRPASIPLAAMLGYAAATAFAQGGDLSSVTMRVLDDVSDVDAVVLALDANRADGAEAAEREGRDSAADSGGREPTADTAEDRRSGPRRVGDELHDLDVDERSEGRLEDRDIERPADPLPPTP